MTKNLLIQFIDSCDDAILLLKNTIDVDADNESSLTFLESKFVTYIGGDVESGYKVLYMNPAYRTNFLNLYPQKIYGDFVFDDEYIKRDIVNRLIQHRELFNLDKVIYIHGYPMNALYYVLLFRDITDQYRIREMTNKNKLLLEGVFESSFSALCVSDLDGEIVKFNRRFYSHLLSNYEFNFTAGLNKGKVYDLPCFESEDVSKIKEFYAGTKERGCKIGEFYFTPYISGNDTGSYVLVELKLDHMTAVREQVLSELPDSTSRTLLSNLESDVIRLQRRVFEDNDSVITLVKELSDRFSMLSAEMISFNEKLKPFEDLRGFMNILHWIGTNVPWKIILAIFMVYGGLKLPPVHEFVLDQMEIELHPKE